MKKKVWVLFKTDGYHPSVHGVYGSEQKVDAELARLEKDEEAKLWVFNKFYANSYEVQ